MRGNRPPPVGRFVHDCTEDEDRQESRRNEEGGRQEVAGQEVAGRPAFEFLSMSQPADPLAVLLDEVATAVPRLLTRTRRQIAVGRNLATLVLCRRLPEAPPARPVPGREQVSLTVVDVVAEDWTGSDMVTAPEADGAVAVPSEADVSAHDLLQADGYPVPDATELALEDYDALAASQVVPRLGSLTSEQLELVRSYERSHRNRQTILNRVGQLLDPAR